MIRSFLLLSVVTCAFAQELFGGDFLSPPKAFNVTQEKVVVEKWKHLEKTVSGVLDEVMRRALPVLMRTSGELDLSQDCQDSLIKMVFGIRNMKSWAFRMLDATGKPPGGLLDGTLTALGSYDECLKVRVPDKRNPELTDFTGKYCTLEIRLPLPPKPDYLTVHFRNSFLENHTNTESIFNDIYALSHYFYLYGYRMGVCIPSTCSEDDLLKVGHIIAERLTLEVIVPRCEALEPRSVNIPQIVFGCVIGFLIALVVFASIVEVVYEKIIKDRPQEKHDERSLPVRTICCFSLFSNFPRLFSEKTTVESKFLHGMRAISLGWLILGGVFMLINYQILRQSSEAVNFSRSIIMQAVLSHSLAIDTLFFTTAYLTGTSIAAKQSETFKIWHFIQLFVHRVFRFTSVHMFMVGICILLPLLVRGPLWMETLIPIQDNCVNYWWTNLLYINNIFPDPASRCLPNSWYLSSEVQLFIIGLIFAASWCTVHRSLGVLLACGAVLVSIVTTGVVTSYFSYPPIALFAHVDLPARASIENALQQKFYPHLPTWFAGLALGFYQKKKKHIAMKPYVLVMGWLLCFTCMTAVVFGIYEWNRQYWMNPHLSALYSAAHRPVWAFCITWLAFVCANGNAKSINSILSWYGFTVMSRLTVLMILTYTLIQNITMANIRERLQASSFMSLFLFSGILLITGFASAIFYLLVELPFIEFKKLIDSLILKRSRFAQKAFLSSMIKDERKFSSSSLPPWYERKFSTSSLSPPLDERKFSTSSLSPPLSEHPIQKSPKRFQKRESCLPLNVNEMVEVETDQ